MKFLPKPLTQKIAAHSLALSGALVLPMLAQGAEFDIRSQSLDKALAQLSSQADMPIVAAQKLLSGKNAQAVSGEMTVEQALERMLQGSNLTYSKTDSGQIVITSFATQGESDGENPDRSKEAGGEADEEVVITGSRLIKEPHQLTRQITVFDRAEIERSGITRLDEFLRRLPQNVNSPSNIGSGFNDVGDFGLGSNVFAGSSVNLRGLGSQYTLILIDGRRPPKGGQFGGITDISNIPVDRVERVEILFDGAAAVYGADAVGGVINIITNRDYQGTSVSLAASGTEEGGGSRLNFSVGHTFNWDGGGLTTTFSYQSQNAIDGSQRVLGLEETTVFGLQPSDPGNVSAPTSFFTGQPEGALFWVNDATNERLSGGVEVDVQDFFGIRREVVDRANPMPSFGATIVPGQEPIDPRTLGFRAVTFAQLPEFSGQPLTLDDISTSDELGSSTFVPFQGNSISPEDKTYSVGISLNQNLTDSLQMNLSLDYSATERDSNSQESTDNFNVPANSLTNPFGRALSYSFTSPFPQETREVEQTTMSIAGGLDWNLSDNWLVRFGFGLGRSENEADTLNQIRRQTRVGEDDVSLFDAFRGFREVSNFPAPPTRVLLGTVFNDPLLGYGSEQELVDALVIPMLRNVNNSDSRDVDISLQGDLFDLPAGAVRSSFTLAHRRQTNEVLGFGQFGAELLNDSPTADYSEAFGDTANALAVEFAAPLSKNVLANISARHEEYSNTDDSGLNWAAGVNWTANDWMTVRLNRTYSLRVPDSIRSARATQFNAATSYSVETIPGDRFSTVTVFEPLFTLAGGTEQLVSERNKGLALGFIFTPTFAEGLSIELNLTESDTLDQIGRTGLSLTTEALLPENIANNPLIRRATEADGSQAYNLGNFGSTLTPNVGDLIVDNRDFNIGDTFNRGADMQLRYNYSSEVGDWLLIWRHQYINRNDIVVSNLCAQLSCRNSMGAFGDVAFETPRSNLGTVDRSFIPMEAPLPRNRGGMELNWNHRGLGINLNTSYESETSIIRVPRFSFFDRNRENPINVIREDTKPPVTLNMSVSYDFSGDLFDAPQWLENTRVSLTVGALYEKDREVSTVILSGAEDPESLVTSTVNPFVINPRGREFTLSINGSF